MNKFFKKIGMWTVLTFQSLMFRFSFAMKNVEEDVLKADPNDLDDRKKQQQRMQHRNPIAEKMLQGQRDEKFVQDYYEVLKKADAFMKNSTPSQMQVAAEKWGLTYGKTDGEIKNVGKKAGEKPKKDRWGRRYEHFGFFDPKNKNYGKTLAEVLAQEAVDRSTDDDPYPIEIMFSNKPIELGLAGTEIKEIKYIKSNDVDGVQGLENVINKKFPLSIIRDVDVINKIEYLTEHVHIKRIDDEHKIIEFFIPAKYKAFDLAEDSDMFKELVTMDQIWMYDEWKKPFGYKFDKYKKRIILKNNAGEDQYHVIKINANKIENVN